ncbi:MarR family winged helix-turn-helix transcriptional regulator [Leifsonia sp. McL0607]|uniref:MarR family winged helix-turn-helix transcriptional regulator n=1 Tax=Leifsonia sp. McL0607 TaxID=3415672 RepID=UPI003CEC0AF7
MSDDPDLSPVIEQDPLDLRLSIASIVHWAESREVRVRVMEKIGFPVDDIPMFVVVNQLAYRGALRPTDLAATLGTGKANISKIVRRLEEIGLVARVPAPRDERSVLVTLTDEGRVLGERIMEVAQAQVDEVTLGWDPQEVENLRRYVARFARHAFAGLSMTPGLRER